MNYGRCSSYQKDSFRLKQDQALGFLDPLQIPDATDQLSSIVENQLDIMSFIQYAICTLTGSMLGAVDICGNLPCHI